MNKISVEQITNMLNAEHEEERKSFEAFQTLKNALAPQDGKKIGKLFEKAIQKVIPEGRITFRYGMVKFEANVDGVSLDVLLSYDGEFYLAKLDEHNTQYTVGVQKRNAKREKLLKNPERIRHFVDIVNAKIQADEDCKEWERDFDNEVLRPSRFHTPVR